MSVFLYLIDIYVTISIVFLLFRFFLAPNDAFYHIVIPKSSSWTHFVMNYLGPESYQGVRLYENGELVGNDTFAGLRSTLTGNGRIVVGHFSTDQD